MHKLSIATAALAVAVMTGAAAAQPSTAPQRTHEPGDTYDCTEPLGHLRRVYEEELDAVVDPVRVWVTPICINEDPGPIRNAGNSGALRAHIASNAAMRDALFDANFGPDDVVGIRMTGEDSLILFVYPFHR